MALLWTIPVLAVVAGTVVALLGMVGIERVSRDLELQSRRLEAVRVAVRQVRVEAEELRRR
ncbi:MAG: hypothetical protein AB7L84_03305 [Acidimicrobiia bacterium]